MTTGLFPGLARDYTFIKERMSRSKGVKKCDEPPFNRSWDAVF